MRTPRIIVNPPRAARAEGGPARRIPGERVEGTIREIDGDDVILELEGGGKGVLATGDFSTFPTVGDKAEGIYLIDDRAGGVSVLTTAQPVAEVDPKNVAPGTLVKGTVIEAGKPGLRVRLGDITGFFAAAQLPGGLLREPEALLRKELVGYVSEVRRGELVLGLRAALEQRSRRRAARRIAAFREGERVSGTVARRTDFGYFIDLGGVDGLLHVSRVQRHDELRKAAGEEPIVLEPRQPIEVVILRVEPSRGRLGLDLPAPPKAAAPATSAGGDRSPAPAPSRRAEPVEVNGIIREVSADGASVYIGEGVEGWVPSHRFGHAAPRPGELRAFRVVGRDGGRLDLSLELRGVDHEDDDEV